MPPPVTLDGACWIWTHEPITDATRNAPAGRRHFRKSINFNSDSPVKNAIAVFAADNHFRLVVNGKDAGAGDDWRRPVMMDIAGLLREGRNEFHVIADNDADGLTITGAGLIGKVRIGFANGTATENATGDGWESSVDGKEWHPARVLGGVGMPPWSSQARGPFGGRKNLWSCFRKSFRLTSAPATAPTRIAVDSKYWLWVNGVMVVREGGLKRGPAPDGTFYDELDLAPYLRRGNNTIAVQTWYWGRDGFSHRSSGRAGLLFEMNADALSIISDTSWRVRVHPAFGTARHETNFRLAESPIRFDARMDMAGWPGPSFDDGNGRGWTAPAVLGRPPCAPWDDLYPRQIPQWRDYGMKDYENAGDLPKEGTGGAIRCRLPYNAQVTPWLKVWAPAGLEIGIGTDDKANEITAEYMTKDGEQQFETPAWMNGHNVIYTIPAGVRILGLRYRETGYDTDFAGEFSCDDPFLVRLRGKCARTLYLNMRDNFFDCPDRERAEWWGDVVIELGQAAYAFDSRAEQLVRKCVYDLCDGQRPSKELSAPAPAGNWDKELPQQMLASVGRYGIWTYYMNTGDRQTLADAYPHVRDYLSLWKLDGDGLVAHRAGGWDWGDWGGDIDIRVLDQAWYCLALDGAARMADELGHADEAAGYRRLRGTVADATNRKFWTGSAYRNPAYRGATDDRAQGLAVVAGIAGADKFAAIRKVLAAERHASPYMEKYVLEALFMMDDAPAAIARMKARYRAMVEADTSTLWELFGCRGGTLNHAWSGGPLTLMSQYVAGIAPLAPGYRTFLVRPHLGPLTSVHAVVPAPPGRIVADITRAETRFTLRLVVPEGARARILIPEGGSVMVNDWPIAAVSEVAVKGVEAGNRAYEAGPGTWKFSFDKSAGVRP